MKNFNEHGHPYIRVARDRRSCNCCSAQNYVSINSPSGRKVDVIYEVVISRMVNAVCPECLQSLANTAQVLTHGNLESIPYNKEEIRIQIRDCNGKVDTLVFTNRYDVYRWAESYMLEEDDEILVITQGNICLYSGLQSDRMLTCDDITGFFA